MSMNGQQIYENFQSAPGPQGLMSAQEKLTKIMDEYRALADEITAVAASMEEGWQGDASGAAQRGAGPLAVQHGGASAQMNTAQQLLRHQIDSFTDVKHTVQPVPPMPESPSTMENVFTLGSAQNRYEEQAAATQAAERHNVDAMNVWTEHSGNNGRMMPHNYGELLSSPPSITMNTGGPGGQVGDGGTGGPEVGGPSGDSGGTRASNVGGPGTSWSPPPAPGGPGGTAVPPAASTGNPPGGTTPSQWVPPGSTRTPGGGWQGDTGTGSGRHRRSPDGIAPVNYNRGGGPGATSGTGGTGRVGGTSGIGGGSAGSRLYGGGPGSGGPGSGAGQNLGPGKGSGVGAPGSGGTGTAAGAGRAGGAAGGRGAMPMGAGAGGGRGQGAEDEEHQRKYVLDDDEHFQLTEDGQKLTDPTTGLPTTPPVLGERKQ